jgi:signal transduction histidine kinase
MIKNRLSLSTYLAFWLTLMVLFTGIAMIITINVISSVLLNDVLPVKLIETTSSKINVNPVTQNNNAEITEEDGFIIKVGAGLNYNEAVQKALEYLRLISLASLAVVLMFGSLGAYWLSKIALRPVKSFSKTVNRIHANNLTERIPTDGPEDEIKELACSFNIMLSQLEQHIDQQRRFSSDIAHELRTPLSVMQINLESLQDNPKTSLEEYREGLGAIHRQLERLKELIDDLLTMSDNGATELMGTINITDIISLILFELEPIAEKNHVTMRMEGPEDVYCTGKEALLNRAFSNIIENAIRYNRIGGEVTVALDDHPDYISIIIRDTGIGIAEVDLSHIFEAFYRADRSRSRHYGGAGLGLAIAALIIEGHKGTITVDSNPGEGSTFIITLNRYISGTL